jgi:hypothetical protein
MAQSIAARFGSHLRIPRVEIVTHPILSGSRNYLRALRAAEMAAWEANLPRELAAPFAEVVAETQLA